MPMYDKVIFRSRDMAARANKPITVTLGTMAGSVEARVRSGAYVSASEVVRAGLRALDREEALFEQLMKAKVGEALADTRPDVPIEDAFARAYAMLDGRSAREVDVARRPQR